MNFFSKLFGANKYHLKIYTDDEELYSKYKLSTMSVKDKYYYDSGFDIFVPENIVCESKKKTLISSKIDCEMTKYGKPCGFYVYPRSSISKIPLRLANSVGIIDSGYRGFLLGAFDNICEQEYVAEKHSRLLQICAPDLSYFTVEILKVDNAEELKEKTSRGGGGYGSTGK